MRAVPNSKPPRGGDGNDRQVNQLLMNIDFYTTREEWVTYEVSSVSPDYFANMARDYCANRVLSDAAKKEFRDDAIHFRHEFTISTAH